MKERMEELFETVEEEVLLQKELLALGVMKRAALVAVDMAKVEAVLRKEQTLLLAVAGTAGKRLRLTEECSKALGAPRASLSEMAARIGEPGAAVLRRGSAEIRKVMKELRRVTESNRELTRESLTQVKHFFRAVSGAGEPEAGYTRQGMKPSAAPARLMIDEVA